MAGTRTTRITGTLGTASEEGEDTQGPQDASDILGIESEIGGGASRTSPRRSPLGGVDPNKGIDLSKRPSLDLEKPGPPRRGIGIDIGKSEAGNLGIGIEIPIPVPAPISARGKIAIDPATGKIRGGGLGLGLSRGPIGFSIDVGVDTPSGSNKLGCFKYVTVTVASLFSHSFGKNECEERTPSTPPTSIPTPFNPGNFNPRNLPTTKLCEWGRYELVESMRFPGDTQEKFYLVENVAKRIEKSAEDGPSLEARDIELANNLLGIGRWERWSQPYKREIKLGIWIFIHKKVSDLIGQPGNTIGQKKVATLLLSGFSYSYGFTGSGQPNFYSGLYDVKVSLIECDPPPSCPGGDLPPPSLRFPIPNHPPRKRMKDCCDKLEALQLETLRMLGRQVVKGKLAPVGNSKGFLGERIERVKTPILDARKPEKETVQFATLYQMLAYELKQAIDMDVALDPKSYKIPTGYLQNPEYSRNSETSLTNNKQPGKDAAGNKRELEIHEDKEVSFSGFIQQQSYIFEAIKRLEYLFPFGELSDAKIAKDLLIPGQQGDIKIHNIIMFYELQMQYLNATLGNPREILTIKDANPAIVGDQPIEVQALSISDLLRQNVKFHIDTGGDVDAAVNLLLRIFRTNMANRLDIIKTAEMTQALFEDSGMREQQDYIPVHLEGDPYAGQWVKGQGFQVNPDLEKKTEEATEKVLRETMNPTDIKLKVSRRHKDEKTDVRDLLRGLADFVQRLLSIPSAGDAAKSIDKLIESAKFKVQTDMALIRQNAIKAATASRNRTKKRKK